MIIIVVLSISLMKFKQKFVIIHIGDALNEILSTFIKNNYKSKATLFFYFQTLTLRILWPVHLN